MVMAGGTRRDGSEVSWAPPYPRGEDAPSLPRWPRAADKGWDLGDYGCLSVAGLEALMASKDKGGRSKEEEPAAKDLKQKRLDKKAKKDAAEGKNKVV